MRYTGPKARLCRREGINLFGSAKYQELMQRNQSIPGMHGGRRSTKTTEYGKQLREKQKAKRMFCLSEKQFRNYFDKATRKQGVTGDALLEGLERRLDNVIYRSGFAVTRMQARQFASHGLFMLNKRKVDIPSIELKVGDVVEIKESKKKSSIFKNNQEELKDYSAPPWLKIDVKKGMIEVVKLPEIGDYETVIEPRLIVEFYSR